MITTRNTSQNTSHTAHMKWYLHHQIEQLMEVLKHIHTKTNHPTKWDTNPCTPNNHVSNKTMIGDHRVIYIAYFPMHKEEDDKVHTMIYEEMESRLEIQISTTKNMKRSGRGWSGLLQIHHALLGKIICRSFLACIVYTLEKNLTLWNLVIFSKDFQIVDLKGRSIESGHYLPHNLTI